MSKNASTITSFKHAYEGLKTAFKQEPNFKVHATAGAIVIILALLLGVSKFEWLILVFTIFFVLIMELLNTVLEAIVNLVQPTYHKQAKVAKDVAAAGVLMSAVMALIVAMVILLPYFRQ